MSLTATAWKVHFKKKKKKTTKVRKALRPLLLSKMYQNARRDLVSSLNTAECFSAFAIIVQSNDGTSLSRNFWESIKEIVLTDC